jgi:predicted DNA-binding WGR domain protein
MIGFHQFLTERLEAGGFSTEDVLSCFLPLAREVVETHAAGFVAPLEGVQDLQVDGVRIWFEQARRQQPRRHESAVRGVEKTARGAVEVVAEARRVTEVGEGSSSVVNLAIGEIELPIARPVYLPSYQAWEHRLNHHDALTDSFSLGLILASLACGLDFHHREDLETFVSHRRNLFSISPHLHPVLAQAIVRMTELDRHHRAADLAGLIHTLENYREQKVDFDVALAKIPEYASKDLRTKQAVVLRKLRERLFDISRRNRLLDFQATMQSVNLTHSSVPLSFDIKNIRPDQIFVWNAERQAEFTAGKSVSLNRFLNFAEALYLPSVLDRIHAEARRDRAEFGFAQLRLVVCFLRWANLKEKPFQRYDSPLILLPVELKKQKGIRDTYHVEPYSAEAEVNPVVRFEFKRLYNIDLPPTIDLATTNMDDFFAFLNSRVVASESAVTLQKIDRPRIALIHDKARRKLDQYRRRARLAGRGVRRFMDLDYSYDPANYHPLGLKLYAAKVRSPGNRLRTIIEEKPRPRTFAVPEAMPEVNAPVVEKEQTFYSLEEGETNPYTWQYDLCSVTLANFKYRRMSLVRDYDSLIEQQVPNPSFDATFSLKPRPASSEVRDATPLAERFDVIRCDPTQATAVAQARAGESYIIQGPPGTGKSQTITNLIADYVARGKRVLFVCEKRAAIDVVYARLRQRGLEELCCLIHDSQTDKKEFVASLKQTYEGFLNDQADRTRRSRPRAEILRQHGVELAPLEHVDAAILARSDDGGLPLRALLERAIELSNFRPALSPLDKERLPHHASWYAHREQIQEFLATLEELQPDGVLANHPLRLLSPRVTALDRPIETITATTERALGLLTQLDQSLSKCGVPRAYWETIEQVDELAECFRKLSPLAEVGQLALLDSHDERARQFVADIRALRVLQAKLTTARDDAKDWRERLPEAESRRALELAQQFERSRLAWLQPAWWRLRGVLRRCYDFRSHIVAPSWSQVLVALNQLYDCESDVRRAEQAIGEKCAIKSNVASFVDAVANLQEALPRFSLPLQQLIGGLIKSPQSSQIVSRALEAAPIAAELRNQLHSIMDGFADRPLAELQKEASRAEECLGDLPDFLHCLSQLGELPHELAAVFARFPLTASQLEAAAAEKSVESVFRADRVLNWFNGLDHRRRVARIADLYEQLLDANALEIRQHVRARLQDHVRLASLPAAQLDAEQKEFKKSYNHGRRELEHEFGKSMRYKAIRDLASGDCGEVVKDLKPVWLMSPLSVSDTLPLDTACFDVVIFDEASQITLEEAVPSLFRAAQAIVVGDEMQLPPTSFFATKLPDDEDNLLIEEDGELVNYELESNSFLNHAARNLSATMLGWHYRSRSESLISFSNWAFYEGRLLTVPEEQLAATERSPINASTAEEAEYGADELVERVISFHYLRHGVYEQRRNSAEADYIAHLVRRLLVQRLGRSIGIIAFSEAQQTEIEDALARLAQDDGAFRELYESELEREDDGQFVGLLVKNLENIQGDERDIIILSVCYGRDASGKMRMNFGPINISGGEKRLNVAFSRAKHHMAVVSSIRWGDITNDHNEGANCFKNYLRYAEAVSEGRAEGAARVLHSLCRWHELENNGAAAVSDAVSDQLNAALRDRGYLVDRAVGQSHFRCDLAVRRPGDSSYRLGILVDTSEYYEQSDVLERDVMRPRLLQDFGWNVCQVFAKDWYLDRERVVARILRLIAGETDAEIDAEAILDEDRSEAAETIQADPEPAPDVLVIETSNSPGETSDQSLIMSSNAIDDLKQSRASGNSPMVQVDGKLTRYFEFTDDKSNKFWEITLCDDRHSVRFGRIGSKGQEVARSFAEARQAHADFERLIRQKVAKGYREKKPGTSVGG